MEQLREMLNGRATSLLQGRDQFVTRSSLTFRHLIIFLSGSQCGDPDQKIIVHQVNDPQNS